MRHIHTLTNRLHGLLDRLFAGPRSPARATVKGVIRVRRYDADAVRERLPEWDDRAALERTLGESFADEPDPLDAARLAALREFGPDPRTEHVTENTTLNTLHEHEVDYFDPNQSPANLAASHLALGTDDSSEDPTQSGVLSEEYREGVDSTTDAGRDLETETLVDENEGNGFTYEELGLVTASSGGTFLNRANINSTQKDSDTTATFEVVLQFRPV